MMVKRLCEVCETVMIDTCPACGKSEIDADAAEIEALKAENAALKKALDQLKAVASIAPKLTPVYLGDSYSYPFEYVFDSMSRGDAVNAVKVIYAHLQQEGALDLFAEELENLNSVVD